MSCQPSRGTPAGTYAQNVARSKVRDGLLECGPDRRGEVHPIQLPPVRAARSLICVACGIDPCGRPRPSNGTGTRICTTASEAPAISRTVSRSRKLMVSIPSVYATMNCRRSGSIRRIMAAARPSNSAVPPKAVTASTFGFVPAGLKREDEAQFVLHRDQPQPVFFSQQLRHFDDAVFETFEPSADNAAAEVEQQCDVDRLGLHGDRADRLRRRRCRGARSRPRSDPAPTSRPENRHADR